MGGGASCDAGAPRDEVIVDGDAGILERAGAELLERPAPARELRRLIDGGGLCAVVAPSGSGKSTFVASAVAALRAEGAFDVVRCALAGDGAKVLVVLDALNELDGEAARALGWIPAGGPATILATCIEGGANGGDARVVETLRALRRADVAGRTLALPPLDAGEQAAPRARRVDGGAAEARGQGGPVEPALPPARRLRRGRLARTVAGAYDALLAALPDDAAAKLLLCSIWVSGGALFPAELVDVVGEKPAKALAAALRGAALREAAPVVRFVHQQARDAVERRWLGKKGAKRDAHAVLFRYFAALRRRRRGRAGPLAAAAHAVGAGDAAAAKRYLCAVAYGERKCAAGLAGDLARDYEARALPKERVRDFAETARANARPGPGPLGRGPLGAAGAERATHVRAFSPREHHLLSVARRGDGGSDAFLFDVDTAEKLAAYDVPEGFVCDARWAPDGERFALALGAASVVFAGDGSSNARLATVDGGAAAVCFSADGASLLAARGTALAACPIGASAAPSAFAAAHDEKINAVDAVEACVATAGDDGRVALYDATTGTVARVVAAHGDAAKVVRLFRFQDELWALSGSEDRTARLICAKTGASHALRGHSAAVSAVAPGGFARRRATTARGAWDLRLVQTQDAIPGSDRAISGVVCRPDGSLVVADVGGVVRAFDATGEAVLWTAPKLESGGHDAITSLALDADGARVACGAYRRLHVLDATTGASLAALPFGDWVNACAWGAKDLVIFAGDAAAVVVMDLAGPAPAVLTTLDHDRAAKTDSVLAVATAADVVATGDNDCRVRVWTGLDSATHVASEDLGGWVTSLALSPNGSDVLAATFGRDAAPPPLAREGRLEMMARRPGLAHRLGSSRSSRSSRRPRGSPDGVGGQGAVHADTATLAVGDEAGRLYVLDLDVDGHFTAPRPTCAGAAVDDAAEGKRAREWNRPGPAL
ncbi:hypothetical protein JL720_10532 [Aureococcus anophagefferens]|nr:hypothetical protein JL720_10532 [Aureococcus anophagefferens]